MLSLQQGLLLSQDSNNHNNNSYIESNDNEPCFPARAELDTCETGLVSPKQSVLRFSTRSTNPGADGLYKIYCFRC